MYESLETGDLTSAVHVICTPSTPNVSDTSFKEDKLLWCVGPPLSQILKFKSVSLRSFFEYLIHEVAARLFSKKFYFNGSEIIQAG